VKRLLAVVALSASAQTPEECFAHRERGRLQQAADCFERLALTRDPYLRAEGLWGLRQYQPASDQFKLAVAANPRNAHYRVRWGRLFLERATKKDAADLFNEALEIDPKNAQALYGMALLAADDFERRAMELARKALEADPRLYQARELLARLMVEEGNREKAVEEANLALKINTEALGAMAILAAVDWLNDQKSSPWMDRALKINPAYGEGYAIAARLFVINRRYEEAIRLYRRAIEVAPDYYPAHSELGVNLMRLGEEKEARGRLEHAFENGHRDAPTANTLTLIDSYKNFQIITGDRTVLKLHRSEADLLKLYMGPELRRAIDTYEKKYRFKLTRPVQLEVYPDHEDFAVRTMGMPGLGALGVTFGYAVAMDSPSARKPGHFHWASTLWHELSHVFVLTATNHKVPRWFTEGLAVHEETAVSPEWGDRVSPDVLRAIKDKRLLPIAELDRGFIRPSYPAQVGVSYFQAGRICDFINRKWGWETLLAMMHSFGQGKPTPQVVEQHLGIKPGEFDKQFLAEIDAETGRMVAGYEEWSKRIRQLAAFAREKKWDDVIKEGRAIRDLYPEYVEPGSVYEFLADAYAEKGDKKSALAELERYLKIGGKAPWTIKKAATLYEEAGDKKSAAAALDRLNYIYPVKDEELHRRLGDLWMETGNTAGAIREYQAVVASKPVDPAASHYNLARALMSSRRAAEAEEHLLLALEAAPGYRPAQKLLLQLESQKKEKR
jgi:tetratricopeptide (TPR) repeat protein